MVNGSDAPQTFYVDEEGQTHFEDLAVSGEGLVVQKLVNVCVSKQRLFFVEKGSLNICLSANRSSLFGCHPNIF